MQEKEENTELSNLSVLFVELSGIQFLNGNDLGFINNSILCKVLVVLHTTAVKLQIKEAKFYPQVVNAALL